MPRSYRSIVIAAFGCLILAADNPPQKKAGAGQAKKQEQAALPSLAVPAPSTDKPFRAYPNPYADACYRAQDHDAAELCAEWRSAISGEKAAHEARRATNWAIVATFLSLIGVGGLIWTIWQTSGSLKEARRGNRIAMKANARSTRQSIDAARDTERSLRIAGASADAMENAALAMNRLAHETETSNAIAQQSLSEAKEASHRQLRAYLTVEICAFRLFKSKDGPLFRVSLEMKNTGQTPALHVQDVLFGPNAFPEHPEAGALTFDPADFPSRGSESTIGTNAVKIINRQFSAQRQELVDLHLSGMRLFYWGVVIYEDVYNATQQTKFAFFLKPDQMIATLDELYGTGLTVENEKLSVSLSAVSTANQWNEVS